MSGIKRMIDDLTVMYREMSEAKMKALCEVAGVINYEEIDSVPALVRSLGENGYVIRVAQYKVPDVKVGQFLVMRHLDNQQFVTGYEVWIDFADYAVKSVPLLREEDIDTNKGTKAVH